MGKESLGTDAVSLEPTQEPFFASEAAHQSYLFIINGYILESCYLYGELLRCLFSA